MSGQSQEVSGVVTVVAVDDIEDAIAQGRMTRFWTKRRCLYHDIGRALRAIERL